MDNQESNFCVSFSVTLLWSKGHIVKIVMLLVGSALIVHTKSDNSKRESRIPIRILIRCCEKEEVEYVYEYEYEYEYEY